ncbi:hypothetical protein ACN20G_26485 (plasmid) [Streptomyces sp. BI20]|uniref:hypothetical protein n=1 Tax=Streptomyces sp. BI20 TaxID=3403460 RepID=UPI003C7100FC
MTTRAGTVPDPSDTSGRRLLVAAAVTRHLPALEGARADIVDLFTGTFGYTLLPAPGLDPTEADLTRGLRALCRQQIRAEDHLVFYLSCHGQILENGRHVLLAADADPTDEEFHLPTVRMAEALLMDTPLRRLLLILDTCYSGTGGNQAATAALSGMVRDWNGTGDNGMVVVTSTRPFEMARPGAFPRLLAEAVHAPSTAGRIPTTLDLGTVVGTMNANPARPAHQHTAWTAIGLGGPLPAFLPNPRHRPDEARLDLRLQQAIDWDSEAARRDEEFHTRFLPSAQGTLPSVPGTPTPGRATSTRTANPGAWWFTGRHTALTKITRWLSSDGTQPSLVVTAGPGVGKTALLGVVAALGGSAHRRSVPIDAIGLPPAAVPPAGSVDVALYAGGLTTRQVCSGVAAALGTDGDDTAGVITALRARLNRTGRPFTLLLDALDEAADPHDLASRLLRPLLATATRGSAPPVRMLVGTRPHLLPLLQPGGGQGLYDRAGDWPAPRVLDLAAPRYADSDGLLRHTIRCLLDGHQASPYRSARPAHTRAVAQAVVRAAAGSYLVARIVALTLAAGDAVADPADARWVRSLPSLAGPAMRSDLDGRLGTDAQRAEDLLRPLAHALGQGLPWGAVWAPLASALSGRAYTDADVEWLQDHAGAYVVESQEEGRSVYRLYHQSLVDQLRAGGPDTQTVQRAFVEVLGDVPYLADTSRDWSRAHPYALRHLATHAVAAGRIDQLVRDAEYLVHADPDTLLPALPHTQSPSARLARAVYTASATAHRTASAAHRRRLLALDAARYRVTDLARALDNGLLVRPRWGTGGTLNPFLYSALAAGSSEVACGEVDGAVVLVANATVSGRISVIDLATGRVRTVLGSGPNSAYQGRVKLVCGSIDGEPIVLSQAPRSGRIRVWDLRTGRPLRALRTGNEGGFEAALAHTTIDGVPVAVTSTDDRLTVWDLRTGRLIRTLQPGGERDEAIKKLVCTEIDGDPVVVTVPEGSLARRRPSRVWDLRTGNPRAELGSGVRAVACAMLDGTPVAVTATKEDVQVWNLRTFEEIPTPIVPFTTVEDLACLVVDGVVLLVTCESRGFSVAATDGRVSVWELATGRPREIPLPSVRTIDAVHCAEVDGVPVAVTPGPHHTLVWDLRELPDLSKPIENPMFQITAVTAGSLDGTSVAVTVGGEDWGDGMHTGQIKLWDLRDGRVLHDIPGHGWPVREVALTRPLSGAPIFVVTMGGDHRGSEREFQAWDTVTRTRRELNGVAGAKLLGVTEDDGRTIAVHTEIRNNLREDRLHDAVLWDITNNQECGRFPLGLTTVLHTSVPGTSSTLLTVRHAPTTDDEQAHVLDEWDLHTRKRRSEHHLPHTAGVVHVDSTFVDGVLHAVVAHADGRLTVIDLDDGECISSFDTAGSVKLMACATTGEPLVAMVTSVDRQLIEIRDLRTGSLLDTFPTPFPIVDLTFDPEGALVVVADREVLVLDVEPTDTIDSDEPSCG